MSLDNDGMKRLSRQIDTAFEEVAKLSGSNLPPTDYFETFLARVLAGIDGFAGAVWIKTPQGFLQIQCQQNMAKVGLDDKPQGRQIHNELLRQAFAVARPIMLEPYAAMSAEDGSQAANLTDYVVILSPIVSDENAIVGLLEVWTEPYTDNRIHATFYRYIEQMAGYASNYNRNHSARKNTQQEEVWQGLEKFTQKIHSSLSPAEVAFQIANEGRRLIQCDRVSVGVQHGRKTTVECVSGADVVEKSSTHVRSMRKLFDKVIEWNETLTYRGQRDESLPPAVLNALDRYLAESNSKLLVLKPIRDERERPKDKEKEKPCRSAILMECFEPPERSEPLIQRLEVMAPHAASALYNAAEMKAVPLKVVWKPVSWVQKGVGGKTRLYTIFGLALAALITCAMIYVPYPLKMDAKGQLLPKERRYIFPQMEGQVREIRVKPRDVVLPKTPVAILESNELKADIMKLKTEIDGAKNNIDVLQQNALGDDKMTPDQKADRASKLEEYRTTLRAKSEELNQKLKSTNSDINKPGVIVVQAPQFERARVGNGAIPEWHVISPDQRETLLNRPLKPTEPILRIANTSGAWEIEQKIPQKHIGQILRAFQTKDPNEYLNVDVMLSSQTTVKYAGRLYRKDITSEAVANKDDHNESEPVVTAIVTVNDPEMPLDEHIQQGLLLTGLEVKTNIRCGNHSLGYSLFYGVFDFLHEHVIFWL
ncbi:hypothetical protein KIH39_10745 [Telmatocola sphagniphila]|uniref:GAF domain-containing protein n=1 Tax=Telmatocola sphagniphila TaxID=1123043 RepID=A0A8E6BCG8_9BACT|nr:hypothetical protein [Telmatocola sphagniphila]QVL34355.1 hypothetical protein KIH39_10745 [Telmatocola sphagniphila]